VGTLTLGCQSLISGHRWKLQFQLRSTSSPAQVADQEIYDSALVEEACALIRRVFEDTGAGRQLESIAKNLAQLVDQPRRQWPLTFIRTLADQLLHLEKARSHSPLHESRWLNLLGYCMRPGMADGADPLRMKKIWRLHSQGPFHPNQVQVRSEWWIMWRRVAAGLTPGQQRQFIQDLAPQLMPKKSAPRKIPPQERLEMWMAVANMEHIQTKEKSRWGRALLAELKPSRCKPQHFWSLSRMGARELLYGPVDRVIPPDQVSNWIPSLMQAKWRDPNPVITALVQMARKTGDRTRDLGPSMADGVVRWVTDNTHEKKLLEQRLKYLQEVVPMARQEESLIFGEALPAGIVLHTPTHHIEDA
jgi:hypothetical protein